MGANISTDKTLAVAISGPTIREDIIVEEATAGAVMMAEAMVAEVIMEVVAAVTAAAGITINQALAESNLVRSSKI
jgi:hypothetical protein